MINAERSKDMLNLSSTTPMLKTPRELRALLHNCGFNIRSRRGNEEIWEHPLQSGLQIVLLATDLHTVHRRHRQRYARGSAR